MGEVTKSLTKDTKPGKEMSCDCPHCGKKVTFEPPAAARSGFGPTKTNTKKAVTKDEAEKQALEGKVKKGLKAAFPEDTSASDQASDVRHD